MALSAAIKSRNIKIEWNEVQSILDRKTSKVSALSSDNSGKYEYLQVKIYYQNQE